MLGLFDCVKYLRDRLQFVNFTEFAENAARMGYGIEKWEAEFALRRYGFFFTIAAAQHAFNALDVQWL
jgi:hypothetical protein